MADDLVARQASQGEKMIEVRIRFWTNDLADKKGDIKPRHAWGSGVVLMDRNKSHRISPQSPVPFQSLLDLPQKIEKVLIDHDVVIHKSSRMKKYMHTEGDDDLLQAAKELGIDLSPRSASVTGKGGRKLKKP